MRGGGNGLQKLAVLGAADRLNPPLTIHIKMKTANMLRLIDTAVNSTVRAEKNTYFTFFMLGNAIFSVLMRTEK